MSSISNVTPSLDEVQVEHRGAISIIRLSRPHKRNAVSDGLIAAIGQRFARMCDALGMKVIGFDPFAKNLPDYIRVVDLETIWRESDAISLHCPLTADPDKTVATLYDMIHPNASDTATVRAVFVIGPDNKLKLTLTYPASTGRNFLELLRVIDSLQLTSKHAVATPADWKPGEDVIITPAVSDEEAQKRFPGYVAKKPYLRVTPQPKG